jgi:hypothetical protein
MRRWLSIELTSWTALFRMRAVNSIAELVYTENAPAAAGMASIPAAFVRQGLPKIPQTLAGIGRGERI